MAGEDAKSLLGKPYFLLSDLVNDTKRKGLHVSIKRNLTGQEEKADYPALILAATFSGNCRLIDSCGVNTCFT